MRNILYYILIITTTQTEIEGDMKLKIEKYEGRFELVSDGPDNTIDVHASYGTFEEAKADLDASNEAENAERWYNLQAESARM